MKFFEAEKRAACWREMQLEPVALPDALEAYVGKLKQEFRQVVALRVRVSGGNEVFDLMTPENWKFSHLITELWKRPPFAALVGEPVVDVESNFAPTDEFGLCAFLARTLQRGGAYTPSDHATLREAFDHAIAAVSSLSSRPHKPSWSLALLAESAWSSFFFDIAWDVSVILVERPFVTVLLATDTD